MEIATTNSYSTGTSENSTLSNCKAVGGIYLPNGGCDCPLGTSSTYDAIVTGLFCTIETEHATAVNETFANGTQNKMSSDSVPGLSIGLSGVVQFLVSFSISMLLVCVIRKLFECCKRESDNQSYPPYNHHYC
jgi:hypothetical protein